MDEIVRARARARFYSAHYGYITRGTVLRLPRAHLQHFIDLDLVELIGPLEQKPAGPSETKPGKPGETKQEEGAAKKSCGAPTAGALPSSSAPGPIAASSCSGAGLVSFLATASRASARRAISTVGR